MIARLVELLILAAAVEHVRDLPPEPFEATHTQAMALDTIAIGLRRLGCRYTPGALSWDGYFYEGIAGRDMILKRS